MSFEPDRSSPIKLISAIVVAWIVVLGFAGVMITPRVVSGNSLLTNQIWIRDPFIVPVDGVYYMTGTTALDGVLMYHSTDLDHWTPDKYIYKQNYSSTWIGADTYFWAPEIHQDGLFYMFFSGKTSKTNMATGVAVSSSIAGSYADVGPITPANASCIDGTLFRDDDGVQYLVYASNGVSIQELSPDYIRIDGRAHVLFNASDLSWIDHAGDAPNVTEGISVLKQDNVYYIFFSTHHDGGWYCVSYAWATSLLGHYKQLGHPIVDKGGHCSFFHRNDGQLMIAYHSQLLPTHLFTFDEHAIFQPINLASGEWIVG